MASDLLSPLGSQYQSQAYKTNGFLKSFALLLDKMDSFTFHSRQGFYLENP